MSDNTSAWLITVLGIAWFIICSALFLHGLYLHLNEVDRTHTHKTKRKT